MHMKLLEKIERSIVRMIDEKNGCMGWDDELTNDGQEFTELAEGDYTYQVISMERGRHMGSAKLPPCNKATLTLEITTEDGISRPRVDLFLHRNTEWKISSFFRSIGMKKKGEKVKPDWNKVVGSWGRCHVKLRKYTGNDGQEHQSYDVSFYDYDEKMVKPGFIPVDPEDQPF